MFNVHTGISPEDFSLFIFQFEIAKEEALLAWGLGVVSGNSSSLSGISIMRLRLLQKILMEFHQKVYMDLFLFFHIGIAPEKSSWCHNKFFFQEYLLKIVLEFTKQFLIKFVHSTYIFLNFPRSSFWNNSLTLVFLLHFLQIFLVILSGIYLFYFLRIYQNIILEGLAWKTLEIPLFGNTTLISADIL